MQYEFDYTGKIDLHDNFIVALRVTNLAATKEYQAGVHFNLDKLEGILTIIPGNGELGAGDEVLIDFTDVKGM